MEMQMEADGWTARDSALSQSTGGRGRGGGVMRGWREGGMEGGGRPARPLTVSAVLFDGGGRELDGAVAGRVLRERQILHVHLRVEEVHLEIWREKKSNTFHFGNRLCYKRPRGMRSSSREVRDWIIAVKG